MKRLLITVLMASTLAGCATPVQQRNDYSSFRAANPKSILVVPVVNRSVDVDAPDYFLSTISKPLAERGYYVFPVNLVKRIMEDDGLSDANLVHASDPLVLGKVFDADSILYVTVERWDARYVVFSTTVTVELSYLMKSARTGDILWQNNESMVYTPQNNQNTGHPLAQLIAAAIIAAVEKAKPNYIPLARQANQLSFYGKGDGLPAGPYDEQYLKDKEIY